MPTVGWILEGDIERFWEGQPTPPPVPVTPLVFTCKRCGKILHSAEALQRHFSLVHPLELPALYVRGVPLLRESVIRSPVTETDIHIYQCSRCELQVDGGPWQRFAVSEFRAQFPRYNNSTWNARLVHERRLDSAKTQENYNIRFRIPDSKSLNQVDKLFIQTLALEQLTHDDLQRFQSGLPSDAPTREYAGALGDYALGILLKERRQPPRSNIPFEEFALKMRAALNVLAPFNRPVALALCTSIRFNLNDFHDYGATGCTELETGIQFFRGIVAPVPDRSPTTKQHRVKSAARREICPVDETSHRLLAACTALSTPRGLPSAHLISLEELIKGPTPLSEQDLAKLHVICAEGYTRLGLSAQALPHLRAVQFDPQLKHWAQSKLPTAPHHAN